MEWMVLYSTQNAWLAGFMVLLGLAVGSFLNVVIGRLPIMLQRQWQAQCAALNDQPVAPSERFNLALPNSHCPSCEHAIAWYDNIPLLSWLLLQARCRHCNTAISARYPLVETVTAAVFGLLYWNYGLSLDLLMWCLFAALLICLLFIDVDHLLLPDQLTYLLLWLGLLYAVLGGPVPLEHAVVGAIAGYGALWSVYWLFKLLSGKEGMGYGDFKLLAALGAWLGYSMLPLVVMVAALSGAVLGVVWQRWQRQKHSQPIPFGPFLIAAAVVALLWGDMLLAQYWQWVFS
jgi:leader peptidase (prepilin peptidase) / N-methyltransferase